MSLFAAIAALRSRVAGGLAPLAATSIWAHGGRTAAAALLALWCAFILQLDTPYSAMTTVLIVSNPVQGMILSKSVYRLGGTLIGGIAGVTLMALFAQSPVLFLLGFAAWLALCTAASTLLRGFRSYGAVLAGYTVALIAMPAVDRPESIFTLGMARVAVVSLGIASSALVGAVLTGHGAARDLEKLLRAMLADLFSHCRRALAPGQALALKPERRALAMRLGSLESAIQFAAAEDPRHGARFAALRDAGAAFYGALTAAPALTEALDVAHTPEPLVSDGIDEARAAIDRALDALATGDDVGFEAAAGRLRVVRDRLEDIFRSGDERFAPQVVIAADRLADLAAELERAAFGLSAAGGAARTLRNPIHLDWRWAGLNAIRAAAAVLLAGSIWIGSGWSGFGATMMASVAPNVALMSMRERPSSDAMDMVWGVAAATALGLFYLLWVLPQITGFPLLSMWLAPPLAIAAAMMTVPRLAFMGVGFGVFFITLLAPSNPMAYSPEAFLNHALATIAGALLTAIAYRIVLPVDVKALSRHLLVDIRRELAELLARRKPVSAPEWEGRMHDRMRLLVARLRAANIRSDSALRSGFAALRLGRDVLRLRALVAQDPIAEQASREALAELGGPHRTAALARSAEALKARAAALEPAQAGPILRAAAILPAMDALVAGRRQFFRQALQ